MNSHNNNKDLINDDCGYYYNDNSNDTNDD